MRRTKGWVALTLAILLATLPVQAEKGAEPADAQLTEEVGEASVEQMEEPAEVPAEESEEDPAEASEEGSVEQPTEEPEEEPAEQPAEEPVEEPTEQPTEEIVEQPTEEPTKEPVEKPALEEPAEKPVEEPAEEPATETPAEASAMETPAEGPLTETPVETPVEEPALEAELALSIADPQGVTITNNACAIELNQQLASVTLAWACRVACDGYQLIITYPDGSQPVRQLQAETTYALTVAGLAAGRYTVTVIARLGDAPVAQAVLAIDLTQPQPIEGQMPGGFSGGSGGFKRGGTMPSGEDQQAGAEQGFHVTAGKALTGSHNSGTKDMTPNGAVVLVTSDAPMTALMLGDNALEVALVDGGAFTATLEDDVLILIPETAGGAWQVNGFALKTLSRSGVSTLMLGDAALPTEAALTGSVYAKLCAAGYVSADYTYLVDGDGVIVTVGGAAYRLGDSGEMIETEG